MHGGKIPQGVALPQTTHGRYSKHLPTRILATYDAAKADPDLLNLREDIAAVDGRIADVLSRVDTGESSQLWYELKATYTALQDANKAGDVAEARSLLSDLGQLIMRGHADYAAWSDVFRLIEQRRKLVDTERKRLSDMQQMITNEQAVLLVTRVYDAVSRHVRDPAIHAAIAADLGGLTQQSDGGVVLRKGARNGRAT
jgi:hypothetical protein